MSEYHDRESKEAEDDRIVKQITRRIFFFGLAVSTVGAISLWSVWTSTEKVLSFVFGFGGMLLIVIGLFIISFAADINFRQALDKEFDPEFEYDEKKLGRIQVFFVVASLFLFFLLRLSAFWFNTLLSKWHFIILIAGAAVLLATLITKLLYDRIPELRASVETATSTTVAIWLSMTLLFYMLLLSANYISASKAPFKTEQAVVLKKEKEYDPDDYIELFLRGKEWSYSPNRASYDLINEGDSITVQIHPGVLGFDHLLNIAGAKKIMK